jgi:hypothetical protein
LPFPARFHCGSLGTSDEEWRIKGTIRVSVGRSCISPTNLFGELYRNEVIEEVRRTSVKG